MFKQKHFVTTILLVSTLFMSACNKKSDSGSTSSTPPTVYTPTKTQPTLVVLLEFNSPSFTSGDEVWQQKLFSYNDGSVNRYYYEVSGGKFGLTPVADAGNVHDGVVKIRLAHDHPNSGVNHYERAEEGIKESIVKISTDGFDFSKYDTDGDKNISFGELTIVFVVAGAEGATLTISQGNTIKNVGALTTYLNPTYVPTVDGVSLMVKDKGKYFIMGERHYYKDGSKDVSIDASIGVISHELGHAVFDLPDLYDTNATDGSKNTNGIGDYGLMGSGEWTQKNSNEYSGDTPTHMSAWSKIQTGWYTPTTYDLADSKDITLYATGTENYNIIKIQVSQNEYFLLENRGDNGFDKGFRAGSKNGIFTGGLAIWDINESRIMANPTHPNDNPSIKGVDLIEANGIKSLDDNVTTNDTPADLLFYSGHKDTYTSNSGLKITKISVVGDAMTLHIGN